MNLAVYGLWESHMQMVQATTQHRLHGISRMTSVFGQGQERRCSLSVGLGLYLSSLISPVVTLL